MKILFVMPVILVITGCDFFKSDLEKCVDAKAKQMYYDVLGGSLAVDDEKKSRLIANIKERYGGDLMGECLRKN